MIFLLRLFRSRVPGALPGSSLLAVILVLVTPAAHGQATGWTWMGGSSTFSADVNGHPGAPGVYGNLGQAAAANVPGGRLGAVSWTDTQGNFWLFGGAGLDSAPQFGFLNDLWKYDRTTSRWTWMSGSSTIPGFNGGQPGKYGILGTPAAGNEPGARTGALGWADARGNLWLFGGAGFDSSGASMVNLNDLWRYDPSSGLWTWMGGTSTVGPAGGVAGTYRTLGSLTAGSYPGSRNFAVTWVDGSGNFWMFGGYGQDSLAQHGELNDLWKFVPSTNQWAWMSGKSQFNAGSPWPGVYGTLGKPDPANMPGGREGSVGWADRTGNLWLFGGNGFAPSGSTATNGDLNDLWEFTPSTSEWTWMGGSNTLPGSCTTGGSCALPGVYSALGDFAAGNTPGGRSSPSAWTGTDGSFWLLGGNGDDSAGSIGYLNDLWIFDQSTKQWAWMSGSSTVGNGGQPGTYGTKGTPGAGNSPGGRDSSLAWVDLKGNLWMMGGNGTDSKGTVGYLNDLWEFPLTASAPAFSPAAGTYTAVQPVKLTDTTPGAAIYYTTDGTAPTTASSLYSSPINVGSSETIQAIAVATGYSASAVASAAFTINLPPGATPEFSVPAGTYVSVQTVAISDATPGATIYYTVDGTTPTAGSAVYSGAIAVSKSETIQAIAVAAGYSASAVASAAFTINLPPPTFTLGSSPASLTVNSGGQGTIALTITPQNGFNSAVTFACSGLPAKTSCSFNPSSVTPNGATNVVLTIAAASMASATPMKLLKERSTSVLAIAICLFLGWRRRRSACWFLFVAIFAGLGLISACGGGGSSTQIQTPTNATVTVTAASGSIQQTATIALTVN
jgi:N-acetylneuraminic acid mutarotase